MPRTQLCPSGAPALPPTLPSGVPAPTPHSGPPMSPPSGAPAPSLRGHCLLSGGALLPHTTLRGPYPPSSFRGLSPPPTHSRPRTHSLRAPCPIPLPLPSPLHILLRAPASHTDPKNTHTRVSSPQTRTQLTSDILQVLHTSPSPSPEHPCHYFPSILTHNCCVDWQRVCLQGALNLPPNPNIMETR